jgi:hypothetical protein
MDLCMLEQEDSLIVGLYNYRLHKQLGTADLSCCLVETSKLGSF